MGFTSGGSRGGSLLGGDGESVTTASTPGDVDEVDLVDVDEGEMSAITSNMIKRRNLDSDNVLVVSVQV